MLEAILVAPADDRPRRVLSDWLLGRGDPRGEFISCQLVTRDAARARAAKLLALHELAWLRPLPVAVESWTFARGFLATIRVRDVEAAQVLRQFHPLASPSAHCAGSPSMAFAYCLLSHSCIDGRTLKAG